MAESDRPRVTFAFGAAPRLQSWKEIASYFGRSVKTVQRWESRGGLPVYRLPGRFGSVYARDVELAAWFKRHRTRLEREEPLRAAPGPAAGGRALWSTTGGVLLTTLSLLLLPGFTNTAQKRPERAVEPGVREAYLKGRFFLESPTEDGARKAIGSLEQAIRSDPTHAPAYASLARAYLASANTLVPTRKAMGAARAAANKAVALDPTLAEALTSRGLLKAALDWDLKGAETDLRRAIAMDPMDAKAHLYLGITLILQDQPDGGVAEIEVARQEDPLSLKINARLGMTYAFLGRHDQAAEQCRKTLELDQNSAEAHACLGYALGRRGAYGDAAHQYEWAGYLGYPASPQLARLAALDGRTAEARKRLRILQEEWQKGHAWSPYEIAKVCSALGNDDETLLWLERAYEERDEALIAVRVEPEWDGLRSDARFVSLVSRIGPGPSTAQARMRN